MIRRRSLLAWSRSLSLAAAFGLAGSACGTKTDASLAVYAQNLTLAKVSGPFGAKLQGSVDIVLDLGHWATGPVDVQTVGLRLVRGGQPVLVDATLVPGTALPVTVQPSSKATISYTITQQLTAADETTLCAGPLGVSGSVTTSAEAAVTVGTNAVAVTGCP
jgi:lipid-binding SYLF domain-containing protein